MTYKQKLANLQNIIDIQCSDGNWNYEPYMQGLANGLLMAQSVFTGKSPEFKSAPKRWLKDCPTFLTKLKWTINKPKPVSESG